MYLKKTFSTMLFAAACCAPGTSAAFADKTPSGPGLSAAQFEQQAARVRHDIADGRYARLSGSARRMVEDYLQIIGDILQRRGTSDAMTGDEMVNVYNMQERINAALTRRGDYQFCSVDGKTGSHFKTKKCVSGAQAEELRQQEHDRMLTMYKRGGIEVP